MEIWMTSPSDDGPVQVPRWAFRLAGGTMLVGLVAFFMTAIVLIIWLALLTWGLAGFSMESRRDRLKLHTEIKEMQKGVNRIEKSSTEVEKAVVPP